MATSTFEIARITRGSLTVQVFWWLEHLNAVLLGARESSNYRENSLFLSASRAPRFGIRPAGDFLFTPAARNAHCQLSSVAHGQVVRELHAGCAENRPLAGR